ncbi:MAG TPA: response regulator [Stellaceae bacterium]|nr:response regulator [Stellaceae bacterium]
MTDDPQRRDIVLVVDDTPDTLSFLTDALEAASITVLVALDGEGALALLDQITPDLVLMDAAMPGIGGFEACRRLKQQKHLAHIPVIFMTGLSETEHVVQGLEAGGVDYVMKPIIVGQLMARMRVHLANAREAHGTRLALDVTGRFLLATDAAGHFRWSTPQAAALLAGCIEGDDPTAGLPAQVSRWLADLQGGAAPMSPRTIKIRAGERQVEISYLSRTGPDEFLLRVSDAQGTDEVALLRQDLALTAREAEVLSWIARGKPNRDISDILGISPRTVNKHLEQIYTKLGVENRASATALAVRALGRRD